ncbi:uncharacterized protein LOC114313691 [Camellia sinensis]|uniref:uncharacterized protein LOC114313691 n=1 Tax=Camellia sinensis TaxID=4442 RepID=UPI0010362F2A|nr:uncharacterized protein LOC114313691 [Camellia sinensis]
MATKTAQTSNSAGVASTPILPTVVIVPVNHGKKPEKFLVTDFKIWQQKMLFYLTTLNLACFLREDAPVLKEDETDRQVFATVNAWKHADFLCRNYILNRLDKTLYNVYSPIKMEKELWDSLKKKYITKDAGSKKFVVGIFLEFLMVNSKNVISQVQNLQLILHDIYAEGSKEGDTKKFKFNGKCYICDKEGHPAKDCRSKRKGKGKSSMKPAQANVTEVEKISNGVYDINLSVVVSEVNLVENLKEWWVDAGVTCHICADKKMFSSYSVVDKGEQLFTGNSLTAKVDGNSEDDICK